MTDEIEQDGITGWKVGDVIISYTKSGEIVIGFSDDEYWIPANQRDAFSEAVTLAIDGAREKC